ncbi:hypothetical protein CUMW_167660 [Citrus unshiu]|nr:hypothetical protein CUMW_167660 [Citrus unshiu]
MDCSSSSSNAFRGLKQIAQGSTYPCIFSSNGYCECKSKEKFCWQDSGGFCPQLLIMSDLDPDPVVQLNPQTSSNVNVENPQTHSISGGTKRDSERQPRSSLRQTSRI